MLQELRAFRADEEKHRAIFHQELLRRGLKRCKSYWLCAAGGYALGAATGLLGAQAISVTTVAVERTVLRHLRLQTALLAHDGAPCRRCRHCRDTGRRTGASRHGCASRSDRPPVEPNARLGRVRHDRIGDLAGHAAVDKLHALVIVRTLPSHPRQRQPCVLLHGTKAGRSMQAPALPTMLAQAF